MSSSNTDTSYNASPSSPMDAVLDFFRPKKNDNNQQSSLTSSSKTRKTVAMDIVTKLVVEEECYTTENGAIAFGNSCAENVVYEDRFEKEPFVGKAAVTNHMQNKVKSRNGKGDLRMDRISDGNKACGFAWTYTCDDEEGLRGTTYVELDEDGLIAFVREIPEPLYKPGDITAKLLEAVTKNAKPRDPVQYTPQTPTTATEIVQYLFNTVQGSSIDESMRFFDKDIIYRDFNYEDALLGPDEVRNFIEEFSFPGITFKIQRCDDGVKSCCFTWEVILDGVEETTKGISLYEINMDTQLIEYVRDIPESALKPPPLGRIARAVNPGLGVFNGVPIGSREGGK
eukprot:CAMPEP_0195529174 /NCGR_PEP_ID=MMETSP0794_2-20130614/31624_1 /TAXON_ID=515487 /ORGANISM="Stephanopyxis turris, Strain CCMP 815" /LENGTH=340 /DNA_ID=CAMNT_0040660439 /DNA_START=137 /DNA_END=1159 /DNA_ORIENTATION=-